MRTFIKYKMCVNYGSSLFLFLKEKHFFLCWNMTSLHVSISWREELEITKSFKTAVNKKNFRSFASYCDMKTHTMKSFAFQTFFYQFYVLRRIHFRSQSIRNLVINIIWRPPHYNEWPSDSYDRNSQTITLQQNEKN